MRRNVSGVYGLLCATVIHLFRSGGGVGAAGTGTGGAARDGEVGTETEPAAALLVAAAALALALACASGMGVSPPASLGICTAFVLLLRDDLRVGTGLSVTIRDGFSAIQVAQNLRPGQKIIK